ncbi:MAG: hypothetical protein QNJ77_07145 [Acidimicrobiia bacterium]|nr:hypothetical protein [Acidimicrobiia bacterium]
MKSSSGATTTVSSSTSGIVVVGAAVVVVVVVVPGSSGGASVDGGIEVGGIVVVGTVVVGGDVVVVGGGAVVVVVVVSDSGTLASEPLQAPITNETATRQQASLACDRFSKRLLPDPITRFPYSSAASDAYVGDHMRCSTPAATLAPGSTCVGVVTPPLADGGARDD